MGDEKKNDATKPKKMLILRGNPSDYPDECGNSPAKPPYEKGSDPDDKQPDKHFGSLHDPAAIAYASAEGFQGVVLNVSGEPHPVTDEKGNPVYKKDKKGNYIVDKEGHKKQETTRNDAKQTTEAVAKIIRDPSIKAIYGFSGGGYDVYSVLKQLAATKPQGPKALSNIERIVVVGVDNVSKETYNPEHKEFRINGAVPGWTLERVSILLNSEIDSGVVPNVKNVGGLEHMFGPESILKRDHLKQYEDLMKNDPYNKCQAPTLGLLTQRTLEKHPSLLGGPGPYLIKPPAKP